MVIVRSVKIKVKIKDLVINSQEEVIIKITKEVLSLFHIEFFPNHLKSTNMEYDYLSLKIINTEISAAIVPTIFTSVVLVDMNGNEQAYERQSSGHSTEKLLAALRRLIKMNLYNILLTVFGGPPAPWGIMHGVRPTKIVHKYIKQGLSPSIIKERLQEDYAVLPDKATMLVEIAYKQLPFLALGDERTVSIYIGIPFCLSRCLYCSFPAYIVPDTAALQEFYQALMRDLQAAKQMVDKHQLKVQNIYIGGGTPTSLPTEMFSKLLEVVYKAFYQPHTKEFTVEAGRPDSVNDRKIDAMRRYSVDRVSVNPQTMQEKSLKRIGRNHSVSDIIELFGKFRQTTNFKINMDIIVGLPGETVVEIDDTIAQVLALQPNDITLHALALKKGSILKMQPERYHLPDDTMSAKMFASALSKIYSAGYQPYYLYRQGYMRGNMENIGCSKVGSECLYNIQIMEENQTIIGIGPAATTKVVNANLLGMETSFNAKDLTTYLNSVDKYSEKRKVLLDRAFSKQGGI